MTHDFPHPAQTLSYVDVEARLTGALYADPGTASPGILLLHGGAGLDGHAHDQARRYAGLGYAVFAADLYGDGVAGDRGRVMAQLTALRDDPALLSRRARAGLAVLAQRPEVSGPLAAIGFCFGGLAALTLARTGADLAGVVSIHGSLATTAPAAPGAVTARVLICHGGADPHIPMTDVASVTDELNQAEADWQLIVYGRALHGFTHDHAVPGQVPGVGFDARADERSFRAVTGFLAEVLT